MTARTIRNALRLGTAFLFVATAARAADSDPLVELLKAKGVISDTDAASLEAVPAAQQRDRLVELLRAKGILSQSDAASLAPAAPAAAPTPVIARDDAAPAVAREDLPRPVRVAARPPVAHTLTVSDDGSQAGLIYADDRGEEPNAMSFKLGGVSFYPGATISAMLIARNTNTGNIGTNFFVIPFSNTIQGNASEFRFTAAATKFDLKAVTDIGPVHVSAYAEMDFLGNDAANLFVTSNSNTARLRVAYADALWNRWEITFGQAYSWLTPNRTGLGPDPYDVFLTNSIDPNYIPGLTWTRAAQVRVAYHPDDHWAFGIGIENPDQFSGQAEVTFPSQFNAQLAGQFDAANQASVPNLAPDVIGKLAYDSDPHGDHNFHAELTGLLTAIRTTVLPTPQPNPTFERRTAVGGGVGIGLAWQAAHGLNLVANGFYSDGGGRYIGGLGPDAVARPFVESVGGATPFDVRPSLVRSAAFTTGIEWRALRGTELDLYYGGAYFQRDAFIDITSPLAIKPTIGFGGTNSANNNNRYIQELTGDVIQDIWADPAYGVVQVAGQLGYVRRNQWFVAAGAPTHAEEVQAFLDFRLLVP